MQFMLSSLVYMWKSELNEKNKSNRCFKKQKKGEDGDMGWSEKEIFPNLQVLGLTGSQTQLHFVPSLPVFVAIGLSRGNARLLWYLPEQNVIKEQINLCFQ